MRAQIKEANQRRSPRVSKEEDVEHDKPVDQPDKNQENFEDKGDTESLKEAPKLPDRKKQK